MNLVVKDKKIGFIGAGNMAQAIIRGLTSSSTVAPDNIYICNRSPGKVEKVVNKYGCQSVATNEELVDLVDIVVLATKPQDLLPALEPIRSSFSADQVVVSLAAGLQLQTLEKYIPEGRLVRIMTNTPIFVCQAVIGFCLSQPDIMVEKLVKKLFSPLGHVVSLEEGDPFSAFMVASSSGTGFILELMQYWQDWIEEHEIDSDEAKRIVIETFLGTALLANSEFEQSFADLTQKVASKKGVTAAGLQSMRELELEGILRMSFNKAVIRDRELGKGQ